MNPFEMMNLAKLIYRAFNNDVTMTDVETEAAKEVLKKLGDNAPYWNEQQQEFYKFLVDNTNFNQRNMK